MNLLIISHKECWSRKESPSGYATIGGFPFQAKALSELFNQTTLIVMRRPGNPPPAAADLTGHKMNLYPLDEPAGAGINRKIFLLASWIPFNAVKIWRHVREADVVHAMVPGDIGFIGLLVALLQRKLIFVRHCGTWGDPVTIADHILYRLLDRVAGKRIIVMATGGGKTRPSRRNQSIRWIFSTSLTECEIRERPTASPWQVDKPLRLVTVGRLTEKKNATASIRALALVKESIPDATLSIIGDGPYEEELVRIVDETGMEKSVIFHGYKSHDSVMKILSSSNIFLFPSLVKEGFPKAVLEAMACGLPVIATSISVLPTLIADRSGILLSNPTPEDLTGAILKMTASPEKMAEMGTNARQDACVYSLEAWRDLIGERLSRQWGQLLQ